MNSGYFKNIELHIKSDIYLISNIKGEIEISKPYSFVVIINIRKKLNCVDLLNRDAYINYSMNLEEKSSIKINGYIASISYVGYLNEYYQYEFIINHHILKLELFTDLKTYSSMTIKEILTSTLNCINYSNIVQNIKALNKICTIQLAESNLNFMYKLLKVFGISFYVDFSKDTFIFIDDCNFFNNIGSSGPSTLELISEKFFFNSKTSTVIQKYSDVTNLNIEKSSSTSTIAFGDVNRYFSFTESNSSIVNNANASVSKKEFSRKYRCKNISYFPGVIINNELIIKMTINCIHDEGIEDIFIFSSNRNTLILPDYTVSQLPIFLSAEVIEIPNIPAIDEHGFIKVKPLFEKDPNNFLKARYSSFFAGNNYGAMFMPRGGQEVLLCFTDDLFFYPIIISSFYNEKNKIAYKNSYHSFIKSESIGGVGNLSPSIFNNEIGFIDEMKSEKLIVNARKDMYQSAMNTIFVESLDSIKIKTINYDVLFNLGKIKITRTLDADCGLVEIAIDSKSIKIKAPEINLEGNSFNLKYDNIKIEAKIFQIDSKMLDIKGLKVSISSDTILMLKGMANVMISGAMVSIS